jgi:hypothetical protein
MDTRYLMQMRSIKFGASLFASAAALALSSALPVQSLPQWVTIEGELGDLIYDFNSLKSLPNGIKQIDTYSNALKEGIVMYFSCSRWRYYAVSAKWYIIPPNSIIETLAYKLCGKN